MDAANLFWVFFHRLTGKRSRGRPITVPRTNCPFVFFYCGENAVEVHGETMKPPHGGGIDKQTKGDRDEEMVDDGGGYGAAADGM